MCPDALRPPPACNPAQFAKVVWAIVARRASAWLPEPERYCGVRECVSGRLGRDLNIYELCSTRTRRVYLALCSSPLPRHALTLSPHAARPANLHCSGRTSGWPRLPPRPASCPDEAAATGKQPRTVLTARWPRVRDEAGELGAHCGRLGPPAAGRGAEVRGAPGAPDPQGGQPEPAPPCFHRTATSRSRSTRGSRGSPRSATNE